MPTLKRRYPGLKFSVSTINDVLTKLDVVYKMSLYEVYRADAAPVSLRLALTLESGDEWEVDSRGDFYESYRRSDVTSAAITSYQPPLFEWTFSAYGGTEVKFAHDDRSVVYELFDIFEAGAKDATNSYPVTDDATSTLHEVFIGHGRSGTWRELKEFLELQKVNVVTYETEKRHGYSIKETLERILYNCEFAVLLHTAEDEQVDGALRARQNVVHETGLFQGRLGFHRAIIVREEQCESFSNIEGINEIRYNKIREAFGDVLLAIHRELEEEPS